MLLSVLNICNQTLLKMQQIWVTLPISMFLILCSRSAGQHLPPYSIPIPDQYVEENEFVNIDLGTYFNGNLLSYKLNILPEPEGNDPLRNMIKLREPLQNVNSFLLDDSSYMNYKLQPFPRSTLIMEERGATLNDKQVRQSMYYLTRDMRLVAYNITGYINDGKFQKMYEIQLNQTYDNANCRDLTYWKSQYSTREFFLIFCKSFKPSDYQKELDSYLTVFSINKTALYSSINNPEPPPATVVKQYVMPESDLDIVIDFEKGFQVVRHTFDIREIEPRLYYQMLLSVKLANREDVFDAQAHILRLDTLVFQQMWDQNLTYLEGPSIFHRFQDIIEATTGLGQPSDALQLTNEIKTSSDKTFFALNIKKFGVVICGFPKEEIGNFSVPQLFCGYNNTQHQPLQRYHIAKLFKTEKGTLENDEVDMYFYGICTQPPTIVEFDITNIENTIIRKIYAVQDEQDHYFGHLTMSVNKNYILHLLENSDNGQQVVRVYSRNSNLKSAGRFDIKINRETRAGFFQFPNSYFNMIVFRDERTINVTAIVEWGLVLDGRNSSLIEKYKNQRFNLTLFSDKEGVNDFMQFKVFFLDQFNTTILVQPPPITNVDQTPGNINVLYNCGEAKFSYYISDYFNGPNYNLTVRQQWPQQESYFNFENQGLREFYRQFQDFSKCKINFWFPILEYYDSSYYDQTIDGEIPIILVCIDLEAYTFTSYILQNVNGTAFFNQTNIIYMPGYSFIDFTYDSERRMIIALAAINEDYLKQDSIKFQRSKYELHIFTVGSQVVWRKMINFTLATNITQMTYNQQLGHVLFLEYKEPPPDKSFSAMELMRTFPLNYSNPMIEMNKNWFQNCTDQKKRIIKAIQSSSQAIFAQTLDHRIRVFEIVGRRIQDVKDFNVENLVNFDIFDNKYFVMYSQPNIIEIYDIKTYLYLQYRMRLPLYSFYMLHQFVYTYIYNTKTLNVARTYENNVLGVLMKDIYGRTSIIFYSLEINQHNTFIFAKDLSDQYFKSSYTRLYLAGDESGQRTFISLSNDQIRLFDARFLNVLTLTKNSETYRKLLQKCKHFIAPIEVQNEKANEYGVNIQNLTVYAESLFGRLAPPRQEDQFSITIFTSNQGAAITVKSEADRQVTILYNNETSATSQLYSLLYETFLQGQNLHYHTYCHYMGEDGQDTSCDGALTDQTSDVPYYFPIEFVTSNRKVLTSITLGQLFFQLDQTNQVIVQRLPIYQVDLKPVDYQALITIYSAPQEQMFGCNVTSFDEGKGFIDYYNISHLYPQSNQTNSSQNVSGDKYLLFYTCKLNERIVLKYLQVTVYPFPHNASLGHDQPLPYDIQRFTGQIYQPYELEDLEVMEPENNCAYNEVSFQVAVSQIVPSSYSNLITIYKFILNKKKQQIEYYVKDTLSANMLHRDTYYCTKLLTIPGSNLLLAVIKNEGLHVINTTRLLDTDARPIVLIDELLIAQLDFNQMLVYKDQRIKEKDSQLQVYQVMSNWPNTLYCVTNYGIMVLEFPIKITSQQEIMQAGVKEAFKPIHVKLMRIMFDSFEGEVSQNAYGSAFLIRKYIGADNYLVQLATISYYSAPNSQFFKLINVTWNEKCFALNQNSYFESTPEDQLAVSFICNDMFSVKRVCMRPNVEIDLHQYVKNGTSLNKQKGKYEHSVYTYNEYFLEIQAHNYQGSNINIENITVQIKYEQKRSRYTGFYIGIGLMGFILFWFAVFIFIQNYCKQDRTLESEEDVQRTKSFDRISKNISASSAPPTYYFGHRTSNQVVPVGFNSGNINRSFLTDDTSTSFINNKKSMIEQQDNNTVPQFGVLQKYRMLSEDAIEKGGHSHLIQNDDTVMSESVFNN